MKSYIDYFEPGGQFLYRLLPYRPKDKNVDNKEEILNNVSAGFLPGLVWNMVNDKKANEKTILKNNKNTSTTNSNTGNKYEFNIPAGTIDTVIKVPGRDLDIHLINQPFP